MMLAVSRPTSDLRSLLMQAMTKAANGMGSDHPNFNLLHVGKFVGDE